MRTLAVIFALALITVAFEIYSDAALTSAEVSHTAAPDPATVAVAMASYTVIHPRSGRAGPTLHYADAAAFFSRSFSR
jgi:hypothetical protein